MLVCSFGHIRASGPSSAGRFAFEQDLQNVQRFGEAVKAGKKDLLSGTLAELLLQCTKYVDRNFRFIAWRHRFWRKDVQDSRKAYAAWRVRHPPPPPPPFLFPSLMSICVNYINRPRTHNATN